jgi:tetratricopeptide (TPR) repeat protein
MDLSIVLAGAEPGNIIQLIWGEAHRLTTVAFDTFKTADQILGPAFRFLGAIVAFLSGVIAIYLKFHYAQSRLHLRFQEFLEREENRLALANRRLNEIVKRPGPGRTVQSPIFIALELKPRLRELEWGGLALRNLFQSRIRRAEGELQSAIDELHQELALWSLQKNCYERKKAQAHLLKGAIASTRAARRKERQESDREDNLLALTEFKAATGVDPHKLQSFEDEVFDAFERADIQAVEYVGHMHFRLGNPTLALQYFRKCHALALKMRAPATEIALASVSALRNQAEILEWQNTKTTLDQARARLSEAIDALPGDRMDGTEGAELYELRGRVQKKRFLIGEITSREARRDYTFAEQRYARIATPEAAAAVERVRKDRHSLPPDAPPTDGPDAGRA